jgi:hypothetical protein
MDTRNDFTHRDPAMIDAILEWPGTWTIARLALVGPYLLGGVVKLTDLLRRRRRTGPFRAEPADGLGRAHDCGRTDRAFAGAVGPLVWLGAGMLGVFTLLAACVANAFGRCPPGRTASWPPTPFSNISA